jgi:hypothetical protein
MSVLIEFQRDARVASQASATDRAILLGETLLIVGVRLRVDGVDLLPLHEHVDPVWTMDQGGVAEAGPSVVFESWPGQPLIGFLMGIEEAVEVARELGSSRCYVIEQSDLVFVRRGSMLAVTSPDGTRTAIAPIAEFLGATAAFRSAVRTWLEDAAPQLKTHPSWGDWFPPT